MLGVGHSRLEALVYQQPPDLLERVLPDQLLDVDAAVAKRSAFLVRLGNRGLERHHALEPGPDLVHVVHRTAAGPGNGAAMVAGSRTESP